MKKLPLRTYISPIEILEARIAPALLVNGGNLLGGAGNPSVGEMSLGDDSVPLVKVTGGQVVVWYDGVNISGLSVGPGANVEIIGDVLGDIVANLDKDGQLTDSDNNPLNGRDGGVLLDNNINGVRTKIFGSQKGDVGNIITGGSISGLNISGGIEGIYAGDGVFNPISEVGGTGTFTVSLSGIIDVNPFLLGQQSSFFFDISNIVPMKLAPSAGITGAEIGKAVELQIIAGSGGVNTGKAGGTVTNITINSGVTDFSVPSYAIYAGNGSNGTSGGAGGSIIKVLEKGSSGDVLLQAGVGGSGGVTGAGGAGGDIKNLDMQSQSSSYTIIAGDGGVGIPGGAGGSLIAANFASNSAAAGLMASGDLDGDGSDDVVVLDSSSGNIVVMQNINDGDDFIPLVQYTDISGDVIFLSSDGSLATDMDIEDVNNDGDQDIIVTYSGTNTIVVFNNQGNGTYWDTVNLVYDTTTYTYSDTQGSEIRLTEFAGDHFVVAASLGSTTKMLNIPLVGANSVIGSIVGRVTALEHTGDNKVYAGTASGNLYLVPTTGSITDTLMFSAGRVSSLDMSDSDSYLLVLNATGSMDIYSVFGSGALNLVTTIPASLVGTAQAATFLSDGSGFTEDSIAILSVLGTGSQVVTYDPVAFSPASGYGLSSTVSSISKMRQITDVESSNGEIGAVVLAGSLKQIGFSQEQGAMENFDLPFEGKSIQIQVGDGGYGNNNGKGGNGGDIADINVETSSIGLNAGDGGSSDTGAGGTGGSIRNSSSLTTIASGTVIPTIAVEGNLMLVAGNGGSPNANGASPAAGGAGGSLVNLKIQNENGDIIIQAGDGGDGRNASGGAGGSINNTKATSNGGIGVHATAGDGGNSLSGAKGNGGAGGGFTGFNYVLDLINAQETTEVSYVIDLIAGAGGTSVNGAGGAGGGFTTTSITLDGPDNTFDDAAANPPLVDAHVDSTLIISVTAGIGGDGSTKGGIGGGIKGFKYNSVFDQSAGDNQVYLNYVVASFTGGNGGNASGAAGIGGAGGTLAFNGSLKGITGYDPDSLLIGNIPLTITAGDGGNGTSKGGLGGSVTTLTLSNAPYTDGSPIGFNQLEGAVIVAGNGGSGTSSDGGKGGDISGINAGVFGLDIQGGPLPLIVLAGDGGSGGAKGGAGGGVLKSTLGMVVAFAPGGLFVSSGNGGQGVTVGGAGGLLSTLTLNVPTSPIGAAAILTAGDGGAATGGATSVGGKGGDIKSITNSKDLVSSISLIEAGNGGASVNGKGGAGGIVSTIKLTGLLGRPSNDTTQLGVFDTAPIAGPFIKTDLTNGLAQGVFSGRGGSGPVAAGLNGSVSGVTASAIAAIASAVDNNGLFGIASKVSTVKANVLGYDVNGSGTFNSTAGTTSPSTAIPIDGFILAQTTSGITITSILGGATFTA